MSVIDFVYGIAYAVVLAATFVVSSWIFMWFDKDMREIRRERRARKALLIKGDVIGLAKMNRPWLWEEPLLSSVYADPMRQDAYSTATLQIIDFWEHRTRWARRFRKITHTTPAA